MAGLFLNNTNHYTLPTYAAAGPTYPAIHPSVIDFQIQYGIPLWRGYRYWMAYTPYFDINTESPSICATNDIVNGPWVVPSGLPNPLADSSLIVGTCNDPELAYDEVNNRLVICHGVYNSYFENDPLDPSKYALYAYGTYNKSAAAIYYIYETGGLSGTPMHLWPQATYDGTMHYPVNPTNPDSQVTPINVGGESLILIRDPGTGIWHAWSATNNTNVLRHRTLAAGLDLRSASWSGSYQCTVIGGLPSYAAGYTPNHVGGCYNPYTNKIEIVASLYPGTPGTYERLLYLETTFDNPLELVAPKNQWLLDLGISGQWDDYSLYRSVLLPVESDTRRRRLIYSGFSAYGPPNVWIGQTEGLLDNSWNYDLLLMTGGGSTYNIAGSGGIVLESSGAITRTVSGDGPWLYDLSLRTLGGIQTPVSGNSNIVFDSLGGIYISRTKNISGNSNIVFDSLGSISMSQITNISGTSGIVFYGLGSISPFQIKSISGNSDIVFDSAGNIGFTGQEINITGFSRNIFDSLGHLSIVYRLSNLRGAVVFAGGGRIHSGDIYYSYKILHTIFPYFKFEIYDENDRSLNCNSFHLQIKGYSKTGKLLINDTSSNENTNLIWTNKNVGKGIYFFTEVETIDYAQLEYELILI